MTSVNTRHINPDFPGLLGKSEAEVQVALAQCQQAVYMSRQMTLIYFEAIAAGVAVLVVVGLATDMSLPWVGTCFALLVIAYFIRVKQVWGSLLRAELLVRYGAGQTPPHSA